MSKKKSTEQAPAAETVEAPKDTNLAEHPLKKAVVKFVGNHDILTERLDAIDAAEKERSGEKFQKGERTELHTQHVSEIADSLIQYMDHARNKGEANIALTYVNKITQAADLDAMTVLHLLEELHNALGGGQAEGVTNRRNQLSRGRSRNE